MQPDPALADLFRECDDLGAGLVTLKSDGTGWACFCSALQRTPHVAWGKTPTEAVGELVRFLRRVL